MTQNQDGDIVLSIDGTTYTVHQGVNGESSQWYYGTAITGTSTEASRPATGISSAIVGDMYLNTDTTAVYRCILAGASGTAA